MLITSLDNDKIKKYIKLQNSKYRKKEKLFIVEGMHLVLEAYKKGILEEIILEKDSVLPLDVNYIYTTNEIIRKISTLDTPSEVMGVCRLLDEDIKLGDKILILDGIQDPGNLGTIIRSAVAFNIDSIVLSKDTVDLYNPKVVRSTQGMMFHVPITSMDISYLIDELKKEEIPVYGTRVEYGEDIRALKEKDKKKFALIMGNEGNGVREEILDKCDKYLNIEIADEVESLNVGVATSIILYELNR